MYWRNQAQEGNTWVVLIKASIQERVLRILLVSIAALELIGKIHRLQRLMRTENVHENDFPKITYL